MFAPRDISLVIISSIIFILQKKKRFKRNVGLLFLLFHFSSQEVLPDCDEGLVLTFHLHISIFTSLLLDWGPCACSSQMWNRTQNQDYICIRTFLDIVSMMHEACVPPQHRSTHLFVSYQPLYFITLFVRKRMYKMVRHVHR